MARCTWYNIMWSSLSVTCDKWVSERASVAERLSCIFIVLTHWNNSPQLGMSLHSDTLFWFRAIQYLLFLFNAVCLAEKQQISIFCSLWIDPTWTRTHDLPHSSPVKVSRLTITPPTQCLCLIVLCLNSVSTWYKQLYQHNLHTCSHVFALIWKNL